MEVLLLVALVVLVEILNLIYPFLQKIVPQELQKVLLVRYGTTMDLLILMEIMVGIHFTLKV